MTSCEGNHSVVFCGNFMFIPPFTPSTPDYLSHRVVIRGEQGENAVLCTEGATYDLRTADTSNALLLVPSLCYTQENCERMPLQF